MEEIGGCDAVIKKRGKHVDCTLFETTPGNTEGNDMGGDCTYRHTILTTAPRAAALTDTWQDVEDSADGWNFAEFSILGESVSNIDDAGADVSYSEFGFTKVRVTARGAASLTQAEIDGLFDGTSDTNPLTFDGYQDAASRPDGDFHSLKFTISDFADAPKKIIVQKVEMEVIDPFSHTFLDLSQEIYNGYAGDKIDLSPEAITLVAKNDDGEYVEFAKSEFDFHPITKKFTFQHRSDVYAMISDNFEIRFRDPRVQIKYVKIHIFDCENNAIRGNADGLTAAEQSQLIGMSLYVKKIFYVHFKENFA